MRSSGWPVTLGAVALTLCGCRQSTAMETPPSPRVAATGAAPRVDALKATVNGLYADLAAGRTEAAFSGYSKVVREHSTPARTAEWLRKTRETVGDYVGLEGGELRPAGTTADGQPVIVLGVTVRYTRGPRPADFAFVHEDGAWRLAAWGPRTSVPDDASARTAARALMDDFARGGPLTLVPRLSASARAQTGDAALLRNLGQVAAVYGGLRRYELGEPGFAGLTCRELKGTGEFEHGRARITLGLCSESDTWMLETFDYTPLDFTGDFFERAVAFEFDNAGGKGATVQCPDGTVAIGAEIACRVVLGNERIVVRVRRTSETGMEVVGATPE